MNKNNNNSSAKNLSKIDDILKKHTLDDEATFKTYVATLKVEQLTKKIQEMKQKIELIDSQKVLLNKSSSKK